MTTAIAHTILEQFLHTKHKNSSDSKETINFLSIKEIFEFIHAGWKPRISRKMCSLPHQWRYRDIKSTSVTIAATIGQQHIAGKIKSPWFLWQQEWPEPPLYLTGIPLSHRVFPDSYTGLDSSADSQDLPPTCGCPPSSCVLLNAAISLQ